MPPLATYLPGQSLPRGVAQGRDIFGRPVSAPFNSLDQRLEPGANVAVTDAGEFLAERYGYVVYEDTRLSVLSPIWVGDDLMQAFLLLLGSPTQLTDAVIEEWLTELRISKGVMGERIQYLVRHAADQESRGKHLIATGSSPMDGNDAHVEILVDTERTVGKEREDGSIDFREVNYSPNVQAGERVAWRSVATAGSPGWDITGRPKPARDGEDQGLQAGENIRVVEEDDQQHFYSLIDGVLKLGDEELSVAERLTINGDVSYRTGNLDFGGEIFVVGSVRSGFSVKASGGITVTESIEAGAELSSEADVTVGKGILGRKTKVAAGGTIRAQMVQEASLRARKDILLGNYAYHADLRAHGQVVVSRGKGRRGGSIMGGDTWGLMGVETHIAGAPSETPTTLVAGLSYEDANILDRLEGSISTASSHIERLLERLGLEQIDVGQIRNMIRAAMGPKRKILAKNARQLGELAQTFQRLLESRRGLRKKVEYLHERVEVKIWDRAYGGVEARLGEHRRKLAELHTAPRFHVRDELLVTA